MASNFVIGLLLGAGCAAWVYAKMMKSTGSNVKNSLIVAGSAGVAALAVIMTLLAAFLK